MVARKGYWANLFVWEPRRFIQIKDGFSPNHFQAPLRVLHFLIGRSHPSWNQQLIARDPPHSLIVGSKQKKHSQNLHIAYSEVQDCVQQLILCLSHKRFLRSFVHFFWMYGVAKKKFFYELFFILQTLDVAHNIPHSMVITMFTDILFKSNFCWCVCLSL